MIMFEKLLEKANKFQGLFVFGTGCGIFGYKYYSQFDRLNYRMNDMDNHMTKRFTHIENRFDGMENRFDSLEKLIVSKKWF